MEHAHTFTGETADTAVVDAAVVAGDNSVVSNATKSTHGEHITDKMVTVAADVIPHAKQDEILVEDESNVKKLVRLTGTYPDFLCIGWFLAITFKCFTHPHVYMYVYALVCVVLDNQTFYCFEERGYMVILQLRDDMLNSSHCISE